MKKLLILCVLLAVALTTFAQEEKRLFTATMYGGIYLSNEQAWTIEPSVTWHLR